MSFNKYAQYPTVPGIVTVRDRLGQHLWTMYTDNLRERIETKDKEHLKAMQTGQHPVSWGVDRSAVALDAGYLVYDFVAMPNTDRNTLKIIGEAMDAESLSKNRS